MDILKWNPLMHLWKNTKGADSIIEYILFDNPNFNELDKLTKQIESGTLNFIRDIEHFLSECAI